MISYLSCVFALLVSFYIFIFPILLYSFYFVIVLSFWLVPSPFVFSFFCCSFILPCCSCFNYSFIFPNIFFIFLILYCFLFFEIVLLLFFFLFLFIFFLRHKACGILVPRPEVGPKLLWWELWVQTAGLTENLGPQGISIRVRPPRGPHLSTKTQLYPTACTIQCWTSQAKPVRQDYSTIHKKKKKNEMTKKFLTDEGAR